jgi:hypothetical protein
MRLRHRLDLQSGTALTRQQIRDAWPGAIGPYIERIAGKLKKRPTCALFRLIDRRSTRDDDADADEYSNDRQLCAQLLNIFLARERDPKLSPAYRRLISMICIMSILTTT